LFSEAIQKDMWSSQTILPLNNMKPYSCNFKAYGLGWQLTDINGHLQVSHTGGLDGIVTQTLMIPDIQLGIIVLTNQQVGVAFNAISNTIKDSYLGFHFPDHVVTLSASRKQFEEDADKVTDEVWTKVNQNIAANTQSDSKKLTGNYTDNWFGKIKIFKNNGVLRFQSERSSRLKGSVFYYKDNTYAVKWDIRSFQADAFIHFDVDDNGNGIHFKMKAISPLTDFSYDFQDLDFVRVME